MPIVKPKLGDEAPRTHYEPGMKREDWERQVFDRATYFTVVRKVGPGKFDRQEFKDPGDAMRNAICYEGEKWYFDPKAMLYAVAEDGQSFCIPTNQWLTYLQVWDSKEGGRMIDKNVSDAAKHLEAKLHVNPELLLLAIHEATGNTNDGDLKWHLNTFLSILEKLYAPRTTI